MATTSTTRSIVRRRQMARQRARLYGFLAGITFLAVAGAFLFYVLVNAYRNEVVISGAVIAGAGFLIAVVFLVRLVGLAANVGSVVQKQASEKITKTEGKFKALIQNSLDLITIMDFKGNIKYQSPSAERVLGYPSEELVGQSIFELIHADDHPLMQNVLDQKSSNFFFSYRMQHHDGTWLYFEAAGANLADNPLIDGMVINSRDISDRKREEEARRQKEVAAIRFNLEKEQAVEEKRIIEAQKQEIEKAKEIIEHKNLEITDSINYAFRIQTALLPQVEDIKQYLPESFVFWRPKDIVSGDFYWFSQIGNTSLITAADCTGHGVPGAFMTMIGNTLLNKIVKQDGIIEPDKVLNELHKGVRSSLKQDQTKSKDGMDMSIMAINKKQNKVWWAGANNPLYFIREGELHQIKPDKMAIGGTQDEDERRFTIHELELKPGDSFYIFSDGYQDQFGGPRGRKYMVKKFKSLLQDITKKSVSERPAALERELKDWMGTDYEQVDDILVIGIQF